MACEVSSNSPFDSLFDDSFPKSDSPNGGLDAIAEFNNSFDQQNGTGDGIDPQLTLSNPSTPSQMNTNNNNTNGNNSDAFNFNTSTTGANLDQTFSADASVYEAYPSSYDTTPNSPYFQSVEPNNANNFQTPMHYNPSPLRHEHSMNHRRRSVSEPPAGDTPSMVFHRESHWLGTPLRGSKAVQMKSKPGSREKASGHRSHPYQNAVAGTRKSARQLAQQQHAQPFHPFPVGGDFARPGMQRSQTQPVRGHPPPTSAPQQYFSGHGNPSHPHAQIRHSPPNQQQGQPFIFPTGASSTSRICTPTPAPTPAISPPSTIDPALMPTSQPSTPTPMETSAAEQQKGTVGALTVEELREMITEAVKSAVGSQGQAEGQVEMRGGGGDENGVVVQGLSVQIEEAEDDERDVGVQKVDE